MPKNGGLGRENAGNYYLAKVQMGDTEESWRILVEAEAAWLPSPQEGEFNKQRRIGNISLPNAPFAYGEHAAGHGIVALSGRGGWLGKSRPCAPPGPHPPRAIQMEIVDLIMRIRERERR